MDVTLINPILTGFAEVLPQIGFNAVEKKGVSLIGESLEYHGVLVNISFLGSLKGIILIGMTLESAKGFASKMAMGMEFPAFDSIAQSAVSEMGNMVCANACTHFSKAGITGLDISPPTLLIAESGVATLPGPKAIAIEFLADDIEINVYVAII